MGMVDIVRWIRQKSAELNLFVDEAALSDPFHYQIALLFTMALFVLVTFNSLNGQTRMVSIRNPSQATYEQLLDQYPDSLSCPCTQITVPYGAFVSVSVDHHPVCTSRFVADDWIELLFTPNITILPGLDFRSTGYGHFYLLVSFCSIAKRAVNDALDDFFSDPLLTSHVVRGVVHSNQLQTIFQTPKLQSMLVNDDSSIRLKSAERSLQYELVRLCSCASKQKCTMPAGFLNSIVLTNSLGDSVFTGGKASPGPDFVVGCYGVEALFQSTLDCFFDRECLDEFLALYSPATSINVTVLNASQTNLGLNTTVETIFHSIFVEWWSTASSFSNYVAKCLPNS